jgi:hypothetical protein
MAEGIGLQKTAVTEGFLEVEPCLRRIAHKFQITYGGDYDEYLADAYYHFLSAWDTYDTSKGQMKGWVCLVVWKNLFEAMRLKCRRPSFTPFSMMSDFIDDLKDHQTHNFSLLEFLDGLNEDVQTLIMMALNPTEEIILEVQSRGGEVRNARSTIRQKLREIGWSRSHIRSVWLKVERHIRDEIK